jgi:hypothetical protein
VRLGGWMFATENPGEKWWVKMGKPWEKPSNRMGKWWFKTSKMLWNRNYGGLTGLTNDGTWWFIVGVDHRDISKLVNLLCLNHG